MSLAATLLSTFSCFLLGAVIAIGYHYIFTGYKLLKVRNVLRTAMQNKQTVSIEAEITDKWTHSFMRSEAEDYKTRHWFSYTFTYENKQYEMEHCIANNNDYYLGVFESLEIGETIPILVAPQNPLKYNLPEMALAYNVRKYWNKMLIGTLILLLASSVCILLLWLLYQRLSDLIIAVQIFSVFIGYPLVFIICTHLFCQQYLHPTNHGKLSVPQNEKEISHTSTAVDVTADHDGTEETLQFVEK